MNDKYSPDSRLFWYLTVIGVVSALIYLLSPILTPFLLAAVIAYICNPLVTWLEARKNSQNPEHDLRDAHDHGNIHRHGADSVSTIRKRSFTIG